MHLSPMPDCYHQDDEAIVLDGGNNAIVADTVTPQALEVAGESTAQAARVSAAGDSFA